MTRRGRAARRAVLALLAVAVAVAGVSYGQALTAPGDASWTVRTVEWVRDNGGAGLVDAIENWWYTRSAPTNASPSRSDLPVLGAPPAAARPAAPTHRTAAPAPTPMAIPPGITAVPGEGRWVPGRVDKNGVPALYTTFVQPDPAHASVVAGVAWIRASDTAVHLVPGTAQPGGPSWPGDARVAPRDVPGLVATFNSGWRFQDLLGGFYEGGRYSHALEQGAGSVVIDRAGHVSIGAWGRDVSMSQDVVAVRQNLHLIVTAGKPAPGIANASGPWGVPGNQRQFTWRSGLGVDAHGNLIYVAGDHMTLRVLTNALVAARAVRAVELDMHAGMVFFARWVPGRTGAIAPEKLLPAMPSRADRFLRPDQRDFFYVTLG
ncbi:hypothetical protein N864_10490 [Intrasporangium chromatireducens Q5-1]|uniref:Phosphodiester glycosidase domain-containing protein n=2 Tax=Intrasporangium TaxID=53357 RepID=W9GQS8_9MICO|nr:hypothetical protein N864_10490 [Intrasporangium chromatireducens Q5-1]